MPGLYRSTRRSHSSKTHLKSTFYWRKLNRDPLLPPWGYLTLSLRQKDTLRPVVTLEDGSPWWCEWLENKKGGMSHGQDNKERGGERAEKCEQNSLQSGQEKCIFSSHFLWFNKTKTKWNNRSVRLLVLPLDARKVWSSSKLGGWAGTGHISPSARLAPTMWQQVTNNLAHDWNLTK